MSDRLQEIYDSASSLSLEETRALAEWLCEHYEDEMDAVEANRVLTRIENGEETYSLESVMDEIGLSSVYANL